MVKGGRRCRRRCRTVVVVEGSSPGRLDRGAASQLGVGELESDVPGRRIAGTGAIKLFIPALEKDGAKVQRDRMLRRGKSPILCPKVAKYVHTLADFESLIDSSNFGLPKGI